MVIVFETRLSFTNWRSLRYPITQQHPLPLRATSVCYSIYMKTRHPSYTLSFQYINWRVEEKPTLELPPITQNPSLSDVRPNRGKVEVGV